jgi:hypothetical protein
MFNYQQYGELTKEATFSILETVQYEGNREVKGHKAYISDLDKEIKELKNRNP